MKENKEIEKLKLSELLLNEVNLIVVSSDKNGNITYVSPATKKIIGHHGDNLLGRNWWNLTFFSKEESNLFRNKIYNSTSGNITINDKPYERKLKCKDGSAKWIEWRDSIDKNNSLVSVGVDITYWKIKEELKLQSDSILESINSMVLVSDVSGNVLYVSPYVEKIIGYSKEETMGNKRWKTTYNDEYEAIKVKKSIYNHVFLNKKDSTDITKQKIKTSKGDYKWIEWQFSKGVKDSYISVGTDITHRVLTEIELKKAKESAEESLKVKNEFLANMSHEIRTPLNAIIGFTDLLLESDLNTSQREYLVTMRNSGEILLSLINNVLDLSKLESEKLEIEKISFNLHQCVAEVVKLMSIKADEKKISLNLIINPSIPKQVIGDSTRLGQILLNLIGNAVKFTNEGFVTVTVKHENENIENSNICFEIKDTGIGIVSNKINTVFDTFTQAKSDTSRIYGGTGLGLAIVKKLVMLLDGKIDLKSKFGKGSVFTITLPLKKDLSKIVSEQNDEKFTLNQKLDLTILLVEDNKTNQFLAKSRLEHWNCKVDIANNGIEGVKKSQEKLYDVILMDIQMPVMDGYEAAKIIKNDISQLVSKTPIIAMSAYTSKKDISRALDSGMDNYIFKPFNPYELYKLLNKYSEINKNQKNSFKSKIRDEESRTYLDLKFLREETNNERPLLILLTRSFIKEIDQLLIIINKGYKNIDCSIMLQEIVKIKPNVSMFGISKVEPVIYKLESELKKEDELSNIEEIISSCKDIFLKVKSELLAELKLLEGDNLSNKKL